MGVTKEELLTCAKAAMEHAYAPYSNFCVGAAIIAASGKIYTGCNVENASYGAAICAERVAITKAISEGETSVQQIAIVCSDNIKAFPCGICLQVMSEFMQDGQVILQDEQGIYTYCLQELLPFAFRL